MSQSLYRKKRNLKPFYKNIGSLWCPAVKKNVVFNMHGWGHLTYTGKKKRRSSTVISMRLSLLKYVPEVIKHSTLLVKQSSDEINHGGRKRKVEYFEIAYKCSNGKCITVVLRKFKNSPILHFWSVRYCSPKIKKALDGLN